MTIDRMNGTGPVGYQFDPPRELYLAFDPTGDPRRPWRTTRRHTFRSAITTILVPANFRCDLASVPWWLHWLLSPNGLHQRAALYHDMAYRLQFVTRGTADHLFHQMLLNDRVSWLVSGLAWLAVRSCGWVAWNEAKPQAAKMRALVNDLNELDSWEPLNC